MISESKQYPFCHISHIQKTQVSPQQEDKTAKKQIFVGRAILQGPRFFQAGSPKALPLPQI
jgi:hypothetical protein